MDTILHGQIGDEISAGGGDGALCKVRRVARAEYQSDTHRCHHRHADGQKRSGYRV